MAARSVRQRRFAVRPDLHVFAFSGDGDAFSIGGNHFNHTARKNIKMTLVVMDNWVYGLTKKQTSPTSPLGFKSKTDIWGAVDQPINPTEAGVRGRGDVRRPHHAHQPESSAPDDGGGDGSRRISASSNA
jgi:TPP-dependent indolepyruvate ferredoxin oxidoreductase alpha subunit